MQLSSAYRSQDFPAILFQLFRFFVTSLRNHSLGLLYLWLIIDVFVSSGLQTSHPSLEALLRMAF